MTDKTLKAILISHGLRTSDEIRAIANKKIKDANKKRHIREKLRLFSDMEKKKNYF